MNHIKLPTEEEFKWLNLIEMKMILFTYNLLSLILVILSNICDMTYPMN